MFMHVNILYFFLSLQDAEKDLASLQRHSNVQVGDLSENDRNLVRSLAIIEVAALLDSHGLVPTRRKKPNRKKGKGQSRKDVIT